MHRLAPAALLFGALAMITSSAGCVGEEARRKAAGNVYFHGGDLTGAAREYEAAIAVAPKDANARTLLGNVRFEQGRLDEAQRAYEAALVDDPKAYEARRGLATVKLRRDDTRGARRDYEALVRDVPDDAAARAALGKLLLLDGDLDGAERELRRALAGVGNHSGALYCLGIVQAKRKQRDEALRTFARLDEVAPGKPFAPYGRAVAAAYASDVESALVELKAALERGIADLDAVEKDPAFSSLLATPRFQALLAGARAKPTRPASP